MTEHLRLIARQLAHLQRMREYLTYSTQRAQRILPVTNWRTELGAARNACSIPCSVQ